MKKDFTQWTSFICSEYTKFAKNSVALKGFEIK